MKMHGGRFFHEGGVKLVMEVWEAKRIQISDVRSIAPCDRSCVRDPRNSV